ncbi:MAG: tRNA (N6-threonylcarbamoyladenosine(37)-N6)-methyltransferase TrmO [Oscillospiraceae bacterium]|nr:tRNA (N6-threonylcarbamoyladenosine(37)-N6)-methyltransferase TrmO [Oscillospiraceae bacterium]
MELQVIGHVRSDFPEKFGIPRQSGLVPELKSRIVFEPEYRVPEAFRGLEGYSRIWIIWQFSETVRENWSPTVRPPRLGGNRRVGVFASRSPFRPNPIGLSSVALDRIETDAPDGIVLHISGADIMDGTPVLDIKPYLPYADAYPDERGGFALQRREGILRVELPERLLAAIPEEKREALTAVLAQDPRPAYHEEPERVYTMSFAGLEVSFTVDGERLAVHSVECKV